MQHVTHSNLWSVEPGYALFLRWTLLAGLMGFGFWIAWDLQILQRLLIADTTRISLLISIIVVLGSLHCAVRSLFLSRQQLALESIIELASRGPLRVRRGRIHSGDGPLAPSLAASYVVAAAALRSTISDEATAPPDHQLQAQVMAEMARGQHEAGWFFANSLVKLGLLGTVIGFVLMLAPVTTLESFDQGQVQNLLKHMTVGMGIALNTTLVGLVGTLLLGMQYLLIDRAADRLVAQTVQFTESYLSTRPAAEG